MAGIVARRESGVALVLVALLAGVGLTNPAFVSPGSVSSMLGDCAPAVIVVCGITLVILVGEIDVSVGSLFGMLAATLGVLASPERAGWPTGLAVPAVLGAGLLVGLINGVLVGVARVPSIIVTLGMMAVLRGGAELALGGRWIAELPAPLRAIGTGGWLGLSFSVWTAATVALGAVVLTRCTRFGLCLYAVGGNAEAAGHAGIRSGLAKVGAFTITGGLVAVAVIVSVPQLPKIESGLGIGLELLAISAAVVGGVSVRGGVGTIGGAVLAAVLLSTVRSALLFLKLGADAAFWERAVQGAFIMGAVAIDHLARPGHERGSESTVQESGPWRSASVRHAAMLCLLLAGLLAVAGATTQGFVGGAAQMELLSQASELALLAAPMALIMLTGGIDLSVGSTMALAAVVTGMSFERGLGVWPSCGLGVLTGAACGFVNGTLVSRAKMHPLIVTLATMALFRGLAEGVSGARPVSGFPATLTDLGGRSLGPIPMVVVPAVVALLIAWAALRFTVAGWMVRAVGFNETACRYGALAVDRLKLWMYALSGACAGIAAVLLIIRRNTAKADAGLGIELDVITAVVLGGVSVAGGRGSIAGVAVGVLLLHELRQYIGWRWQSDEVVPLVIGAVLIIATVGGKLGQQRTNTEQRA